jgi:hypothetical protein
VVLLTSLPLRDGFPLSDGTCFSHTHLLETLYLLLAHPPSRDGTCYNVIRSYQSYTPSVVSRSTCPRGRGSSSSSFSHDDFVPFPPLSSEPMDF